MLAIFIHGWSVTHTETYGELPAWLASQPGPDGLPMQVDDIHLGKYISFDDTVRVDDIARALEYAIQQQLGPRLKQGQRFLAITHSTGAPVVRTWLDLYHRENLAACPLSHLVMLAPANHGSALAQLGKARLSRIKSFFQGIEPGQEVLNWLELGSRDSWALNLRGLDLDLVGAEIYPFVLVGQSIDRAFYDALNSYTGEAGSDGVVRVASANLNYGYLRLRQEGSSLKEPVLIRSKPTAIGVLPGRSHSGEEMGILRSITLANAATHPTVQWLNKCLAVKSPQDYAGLSQELEALTAKTQADEREVKVMRFPFPRTFYTPRFNMLVFHIVDDRGQTLTDYDLLITAGPDYDEQHLPGGFFQDRQRNQRDPGMLTYYLNYDVLDNALKNSGLEGRLGFRLVARPAEEPGKPKLVFYKSLDYCGQATEVEAFLRPNETLMVEIEVQRRVDAAVCQLQRTTQPSVISAKPTKKLVP